MSEVTVFSVGHSNHSIERFVSLLRQHGIDVVADVRSSPQSRYAPHFSRDALAAVLRREGIHYVFLGAELGGRPAADEFYDEEGYVLYGAVAETEAFGDGVSRLEVGAARRRVAMMCSEEDPTDCHRRLLVARVLCGRGDDVLHIRGDGRIESEDELRALEESRDPQESLFGEAEKPWRSIRSVSRRRAPASSSIA